MSNKDTYTQDHFDYIYAIFICILHRYKNDKNMNIVLKG